jgi:putative thiamine transport system ATP-binding protein
MTAEHPNHLLHIDLQSLRTPAGVLLKDLVLDVPGGSVHTVMGPSGSGKSSLLAAVCGTLGAGLAFDGAVHLDNRRIDTLPTHQRRVGLLLQEDLLFAHLTVLENLLFAVPAGPTAARRAQARVALADVELPDFANANPATLSGGQRARVALARALLAQPLALMLDEPFSKLDVLLRERMRQMVFGAVAQRGISAILVTHDPADVADPGRLTLLP